MSSSGGGVKSPDSASGVVEQLRGSKKFAELFDEEIRNKPGDLEFAQILGGIGSKLRDRGVKFDVAAKVQETTIPQIFGGYDVMARAQTGAGKTLAFSIGMVAKIKRGENTIQALCFAPTQELVAQTKNEIAELVKGMTPEIRVVDNTADWKSMTSDNLPHIVVSTVGGLWGKLKVLTHVSNSWAYKMKKRILEPVKLIVLDEADDIIMDQANDKNTLTKVLRESLKTDYGLDYKQVVCYSATYNSQSEGQIRKICKLTDGKNVYGKKLQILELPYAISPAIKQIVIKVKSGKDKKETLERKISALKEIFACNVVQKSIIFVNKKKSSSEDDASVDTISKAIVSLSRPEHGLTYAVGKFYAGMTDPNNPSENSDVNKEYRQRVFANFKKLSNATNKDALDVIVASDVMSRGIDLPDINLVINFDIRGVDPIKYIHRIGRCSRYGKIGTAVTFIEDSAEFDEIKTYCTDRLIPGKKCDFNFDELDYNGTDEGMGARVCSLINEFKASSEETIKKEKDTIFVVREDDEPAGATGVVTAITVLDPTVEALVTSYIVPAGASGVVADITGLDPTVVDHLSNLVIK